MNKKTRKLFAWCLVVAMLITQMLFTNIAFAATDSYKGNDRFSTAFSIVDKGWTTSDVAVIARGDVDGSDLADALAAAPLAYANGKAPVFITEKDHLTDGIMQRLTALGVKKVFIVGGTGAVSQAVEDTLVAKLGAANVQRVSGSSRVETSLEVAKLVAPTPTKVVLVNGYASADALSAAPLAAAQGMPVLFVENKDTLSDAVKAYIGSAKVYVVGGTGVVSDAVKTAVSGERVAGDDRFATNNAVLTTFAPDYTKVYLAKGADANAIDALAGAPLAALTNSPIVFVDDQGSVISAKATLAKNLLAGSTIIGLGGLVTSDVLAFVDALRPQAVNVDSVSKLSATLNNPVDATTYPDVVFNGALAQVLVKATDKNGNPVANVPVVFYVTKTVAVDPTDAVFAETVAYTGADGIAIGFLAANDKITDPAVTVTYKAEVVGKAVTPVEGKVRFAQLNVGTVAVTAPVNDDGAVELTPRVGAADDYLAPLITQNMNGDDTKYVASQQVSKTGTTEHAVTFKVTPKMSYISDNAKEVTDTYTQAVGWKSGAFHPYDTLTSDAIEIPSGLKYATIYLKNLQLDENAKLYVKFYDSDDSLLNTVTVSGPINDTSRAVQIPKSVLEDVAYFKVSVKTAGQVNTTLNGGVEVDRVEGVFATDATSADTNVNIPDAKITWTAADVVYSETKTISKADVLADYGIAVDHAARYDYKVPVFPMTGDAVLTAYDSNNKVLKYYLIPTVNVDNENVLRGLDPILGSKNEVNDSVGTITPNADGTQVTVNSEKVGVSTLKGVIDIPGISKDVLNATNATVYTSVNWAPLPKAADETAANTNLFALIGQKVTVVAQLVDQNGNPATEEDETVVLDGTFDANVGVSPSTKVDGDYAATTDSNGQVKWVLSASALAHITDLEATNDNYDVVLTIGSATVSAADLYWISAELTHQPTLADEDMNAKDIADAGYQAQYNVGDSIEFGFKANGIVKSHIEGVGADAHVVYDWDVTGVTLSGIPVNFTKVTGTVGTAAKVADKPYCFVAESSKAGLELVDAKIGTITDGVTVTFSTDGGDTYVNGTFVGTGSSSIVNKFRMPISWASEGEQFSFVVPQGDLVATGDHAHVYVKLTDSLGNPLEDKDVAVTITGEAAAAEDTYTTDTNGIAAIDITSADEGQSTIKAEYNGDVEYYSINWVDSTRDFEIVSAGVNTSGTNDVVTVALSNEINPDSVTAKQFEISDVDTGTVYAVKDFVVDGNLVKLTLADSNAHLYNREKTEYTVSYAPYTEFSGDNAGIEYNLADVDGNTLVESDITFVTPANVSVKSVTLEADGLHVAFYNAAGLDVYSVDADGQVLTATMDPEDVGSSTGVAVLAVDDASFSFTVYCNGVTYTFFN